MLAVDSTDGSSETVSHDTGGISLWYRRTGAVRVVITPVALAALTTSWTSGGVEPIDDGAFRLDVPDAAFAAGADSVVIGGRATGVLMSQIEIQIKSETATLRTATAAGGGSSTITLDASASAGTDFFAGNVIQTITGTGAGQARVIISYNGTTKVATVDRAWATNPASGTVFQVLPTGALGMTDAQVAAAVLNATATSYDVAGSIGERVNDAGAAGSPPTETEIVTELMSRVVDTGLTFEQLCLLLAAVLGGKSSKSGATRTFRDFSDTRNAVVATTNSDNERTSMSYNLT